MDIEKLNKSQIILLTLLVSFMTSIATGIVTVSLMEQAPPAITQTVSKVIEHTIERVVPGQAAAVVTPGKTVIVKESDLIAQALEHVSPSVVRLYASDGENPVFLGLGVVVDGSGLIAMDSSTLGDSADAVVELSGSARVRGFVSSRSDDVGIAYLTAATSTADGVAISWTPATFSGAHATLGQTAVTVSGKTGTRLGVGLVTYISSLGKTMPDGVIDTNIAPDSILPGSPIFDTEGNVMGLSTGAGRSVSSQGFVSASYILPKVKESGAGAQ
ncbi:hypothetical protein HY968_01670 [Candidatus Kaiserbacteria bacterium]|nr:hypothetical protein [Candidatus Kaiserbacteria bacterium]